MGDRIEAAYSRIGVTSAHLGIVAMILFGVFFDAIEQNTVGVAGPILAADWGSPARRSACSTRRPSPRSRSAASSPAW